MGKRSEETPHQKNIYGWQIIIWEDVQHHISLGNFNVKYRDTSTNLLEWPKPRTPIAPNTGEDVQQWELSFIPGGKAKWCSHFGRRFPPQLNLLLHDPVIALSGITQRS